MLVPLFVYLWRRRAPVRYSGTAGETPSAPQGERQAAIERAEGDKRAAVLRAEGERGAIETVLTAGGDKGLNAESVVGYLLGLTYLKTLPDIAKEGDRIFLPVEASAPMAGLGALAELARTLQTRME